MSSLSTGGFGVIPRRKKHYVTELQLTSMIDMLVIMVIFLLKSMVISEVAIELTNQISLPIGKVIDASDEADNVMISQKGISFAGKDMVAFTRGPENEFVIPGEELGDNGTTILKLYDELISARENGVTIAKASGMQNMPQLKINLVADKEVNYEIIRRVLWTAAKAQFVNYQLTVEKDPDAVKSNAPVSPEGSVQ